MLLRNSLHIYHLPKEAKLFKRKHATILITYSLVLCSAISLTACSFSDVSYLFKSPAQKQAILHKSPAFWEDATSVKGSSNLSILHNVAFEGQPYNDTRQFGDNILMVGQGSYNNSIIETDDQSVKYSFDVYNPWSNEITASLTHDKTDCDDYMIKGDRLWLINSDAGRATIYDKDLKEIKTCKYNPDDYDGNYDTSDSAGGDVPNPGNYYDVSQIATSADGKYALVSGVTPDTYKYAVSDIRLDDNTVLSTYEGQSFSMSCVDSKGFVIEADTANNIWNYHSSDGENSFFSLPDVVDVTLAEDGDMLIRCQDLSSDNIISYYKYSPATGVSSSFSYNLATRNTGKMSDSSSDSAAADTKTYCSANSVYLPDANCVMMLLYTAQCNPEILIWSLDKGKNDSKAEITSYNDCDTLLQALRDDGSYVSPYSAIDPADSTDENQEAMEEVGKDSDYNTYGDEVTLIPDTASYDWGDLSDINARITALEQKYGFSIYFGPEVPKRIDYYDIHQFKNKDKLSIALDSLEEILDCFPDDFFTQLCYGDIRGMRIYLCGDISSGHSDMINEPSGFVNIINNHNVIVLNCNYSWDFSYTVGHEISHLIDQRLTFIHTYDEKSEFSEGKWNSFNPDSFSYDDSYANYNPDDPSNHISGYFIDSYGMTFATEDRSEIFGTAIDDYINGIYDDARFTDDSPIRNKLDYYSRCIRDGFDTKDWPDTMAWESVLTDTGAQDD